MQYNPITAKLLGLSQRSLKTKQNKSETVDCQRSEKRSKTHKRLKQLFLIGRNRTECAIFWGSSLFQAMYHTEKKKKKRKRNNSTCVSWMWEAGERKRARDWLGFFWCSIQSLAFFLPPASHVHLTQAKLNYLFVFLLSFLCVVGSLKTRTSSKTCTFCSVSSN